MIYFYLHKYVDCMYAGTVYWYVCGALEGQKRVTAAMWSSGWRALALNLSHFSSPVSDLLNYSESDLLNYSDSLCAFWENRAIFLLPDIPRHLGLFLSNYLKSLLSQL